VEAKAITGRIETEKEKERRGFIEQHLSIRETKEEPG